MKKLENLLRTMFAECDTLSECHILHTEILELLNQVDSDRRNEIIEKEK